MTQVVIVTRYLSEVCSLSGGASRPYPFDYRRAFASSDILYPHPCRLAFMAGLPRGSVIARPVGTDTGLLRYVLCTRVG